jgi:hypothetical protein
MSIKAIIITTALIVMYAMASNMDYEDAQLAHQAQIK